MKIYEEFKIPPSKQIIEGWKNHPINDYVLLNECLDVSEDLFLIVNSCEHTNTSTNADESNGNENTQFSSPEEDTNFDYGKLSARLLKFLSTRNCTKYINTKRTYVL